MAAPSQPIELAATLNLPRCPHCSIDTPNLVKHWSGRMGNNQGSNLRTWALYFCVKCGGGVLAYTSDGHNQQWVQEYYPGVKTVDSSVPDRPRALLIQAIESKHSPAASLMVCARSVDEMFMVKGYTNGYLFDKIKAAEKNHDITPEMARWSHQVRLVANDQRHPDILDPLATMDDAQKSIDFALALAEYMFVLPSKIPPPNQAQPPQS